MASPVLELLWLQWGRSHFAEPSFAVALPFIEPTLLDIAGTSAGEEPFTSRSVAIGLQTFDFEQLGYQIFHQRLEQSCLEERPFGKAFVKLEQHWQQLLWPFQHA